MTTTLLTALAIVCLLEGVVPLLFPRRWQAMLQIIALQPPETIRRMAGVLVVAGLVILYMLYG